MQHEFKKLRHELKYYIHISEYYALRNRLSAFMSLDRNAQSPEGYHIRSLYFSDQQETALLEKNYGVIQRKKYRIRIYNHSDKVIKLERKSRFGELVSKESASLSLPEYRAILEGAFDATANRKEPVMQQWNTALQVHRLKPDIIVDYTREAYTSEPGEVRLTFDKSLSAVVDTHDIFEREAATATVLHSPRLIMEVKYNDFLPGYIAEALRLRTHQRAAISKYVLCREAVKPALR
ncbi:polyphosphate polymerase domain-containing protein [Paenibacillus sp.]|uniref:polyphosphate polymerase domain-containing protein n=1 Tax=Paenibacillus sp. TaxID=58172 RepID=UPI002810A53A|nr:polyphosphate polymerase domain-containing protein [Paenibacillus sp.]